jgi:predicted permease
MLDALAQDLRYAARGLRAKPGFAAAVILTIALGIGANGAMFGIVDRMLFRPPALMKDPATAHRVYVYQTFRGKENAGNVSMYARFHDLATDSKSFSSAAAFTASDMAVGVGDAAREMRVASVSAPFFGFFDAPPALGRYFTAAEDEPPSGSPVAVMAYPTWQTTFGGRRDALGTKVQIGSVIYTVVGVAPEGFVGLWPDRPPAYIIPITSRGGSVGATVKTKSVWWKTYQWGWLSMIARRKPGVSIEAANADLTLAAQHSYDNQLLENPRGTPPKLARIHAVAGSILSERGPNTSAFAKVATWVAGVALVVLIVACANVANLLLARAIRRRREIAVRLALGVSRRRLLSQLLTESLLLALLGGFAALVVAQWGGAALRARLMPDSVSAGVFRDGRTIAFTTFAAVVVGLLTGLAPVIQAQRASLTSDLKSGAREGTFHRSKIRAGLLLLQGALSVVLLVGAGLFVQSLRNVQSVRLGYDVEPIAFVDLNMRGVELDSVAKVALRRRLLDRATHIPGVERASLHLTTPFWSMWSYGLYVQGIDTVGKLGQFDLNAVSPEFFSTFGTRVLRGRGFTAADGEHAPRVMIVSDAMGKVLWPGKDPIGQCVRVSADTMPCTYVVGVAEDIKERALTNDESNYFYYMPAHQFNEQATGLVVRTHGNASDHVDAIRRELQREMPGASYVTVTPFRTIFGGETKSWQLGTTTFVAFGVLALVIAAIGLYSVIAYNVAQRTHEMGVRVALGAQSRDVVRLVLSEGMMLGAAGVAIGTVAALIAGKWVKPLLFEQSPRDPLVFSVVAVALLTVTLAASWIPARRASQVEPNVALRSE